MTHLPKQLHADDELYTKLRAELADYTVENLVEAFGEDAYTSYQREQRALLLARTNQLLTEKPSEQAHLVLLTRLFLLGEEVDEKDLQLNHVSSEELQQAGLVHLKDNRMSACVKLEPHALEMNEKQYNWWIASDFPSSVTGKPVEKDHVLGIGGATRTLLQATPRDQVGRVLDLGTGCGIIGMYAALHADEVVATDISARAVMLADFNAHLNEVKMQVVQGSLFEPIKGDFDLILSNPPFVITPDSLRETGILEYRDGGQTGDSLVAQVVAGAAAHLREGGLSVMLGNWEIPEGADPQLHPQSWVANQGVDAWVVQRETLLPHHYVEMWLRDNAPAWMRSQADYERDYINWVNDFIARGVAEIGLGVITLRKPVSNRGTHFEFSEISTGTSASGPYVKQILTEVSEHHLEIRDTDFFIRADDVREERHYLPGEPDPQIIIATQGGGFGQRIQLNTHMAATLGACDGELNIGQIVTAISVITGVDKQTVEQAVYGQIPQLLLAGMLTRAK
ncbi:methyltransferase, HemK family [Gleimia coleocanis DSM 15436]|uniref:Methyltransferase, HemK family n=1 Tax=Gleimia coleocanis DSM 15436 TaxID=525245 RepID=C0W268_9ACTO|nr:methyltransferase [Gleimia coleocanis]EEH63282.1 methyltransferase, HemK family [Gleimia coleocanis DSM 15436]